MTKAIVLTAALCTWSVAIAVAAGGERVALIVGNAAYRTAPLSNTLNDARDMASLLKAAGFEVDLQIDASHDEFRKAVTRFGERIERPSVKIGLFYYAGHGFQLNSRNYLIPVNAHIKSVDDVPKAAVDVTDLLRYMEAVRDRSLVVILDACRDDPFAGAERAGSKGLSPYNAPIGTLLAYATGPGQVARDGSGKNGLYTKHLLRELAVPGESLLDGFMRVRVGVMTESRGRQIPWELSSLIDRELYLFPTARKSLALAERAALDEQESTAWTRLRSNSSTHRAEDIAQFLQRYPNGITAEQAQHMLKRMWGKEQEREAGGTAERAERQRKTEERAEAARARADQAATRDEFLRLAEAARLELARHETARLAADEQRAIDNAARQARDARLAVQRANEVRLAAQAQTAMAEAAQREANRVTSAREAARLKEEARLAAAREAAEQAHAVRLAKAQAQASQRAARQAEQARLAAERKDAIEAERRRAEIVRAEVEAQEAKTAHALALAEQATVSDAVHGLQPVHVPPTPYFQGYDEHLRHYQIGDQYEFQTIDQFSQASKRHTATVTAVSVERDRVEFNNGEFSSDLMGNALRTDRGELDSVRQFYPANLFVGKQWRTHFKQTRPGGVVYTFRYDLKVVSRERVTVPAGTFNTYKIEARGFNMELGANLQRNIWVAPGISADIVHETFVRLRSGAIDQNDRRELIRYDVPGRPLSGQSRS